jgi:glycerol dehydrogenase
MMPQPFDPGAVYAPPQTGNLSTPRVFIAPQRYIQGDGVLEQSGRYLQLLNTKRCGVLASKRGLQADAARLIAAVESSGIDAVPGTFGGECSSAEIEAHTQRFTQADIDCLVAVGGGKCVDAGKAIAWRLEVPVVIVPTLASNDAPCSALSVIYTDTGATQGIEFYPNSPALVIVDTGIVAEASERYLVAGMGDAMATWYEARVCIDNPQGFTPIGARPTLAACALGEICAHTLYDQGMAAASAVANQQVDEALEMVVEANTLLSGLGFESGGIAAAHGIAQGYPAVARVHANYHHGEMVGMGLLAQLVMDSKPDEAEKAATFFARVGLPVHLGQLSMGPQDDADLDLVAEIATGFPLTHNMPLEVTPNVVKTAIVNAHQLGVRVAASVGDEAYQRLQAGG